MNKERDDRAVRNPGDAERRREGLARLVSRVYGAANIRLRERMLACLLQPLSVLSVAAVAAGAFASYVYRDRIAQGSALLDSGADFTREQIVELARFAQEVNPDALLQLTDLATSHAAGVGAFGSAALWLLVRKLRPQTAPPPR